MKNPFEKNDHKLLIAGVLLGALAAGAAVYFFRDELAGCIDNLLGKETAEEPHEDPQAYLHHKDKAPKSDREKLLHNEILNEHHEEQQS